ncbi:MAG: carbohydrate ABC transporter permease [Oscillospiraceae bacterium]|nr:carbohydrate ABC transporter permease [Oscillospiraceae bacterium]
MAIVWIIMAIMVSATLYPVLYVFSVSISSYNAVVANKVILYPIGFSLNSYKTIMADSAFYTGYANTIGYTVVGTIMNIVFTVLAAFPLSRREFFMRKFFTVMFLFTMFFGGGLIPSYIVATRIGLLNSRWAMILPGLISTWNLVLCRTYIMSLPEELYDSAKIDGCTEFRFIPTILFPLIKPILAVMVIYYGVGHWNSWFNALLYLTDITKHPLQIYLRKLLIQTSNELAVSATELQSTLQVRYCAMFVTVLPIMAIYPFFQKYFTKGIMIGSLKG